MEQRLPKRSEVPEQLTWRLEDIYETEDAWEADLKKSLELAEQLACRAGQAAGSAAELLETMKIYEACIKTLYRVHGYAFMKHDEDTAEAGSQARFSRAQTEGQREDRFPGAGDPGSPGRDNGALLQGASGLRIL